MLYRCGCDCGNQGETELYFEDAYRFIEGLEVTQLHVFSYSERPGTQALKIDHVVSPEEKHRRSQRLLALSDEKTKAFYARHIGKEAIVLAEKSKAGMPMHGFTDNYIRVELEHDDALDNKLVRVKLGDFNEERYCLERYNYMKKISVVIIELEWELCCGNFFLR